jgi:hypothetical protein
MDARIKEYHETLHRWFENSYRRKYGLVTRLSSQEHCDGEAVTRAADLLQFEKIFMLAPLPMAPDIIEHDRNEKATK